MNKKLLSIPLMVLPILIGCSQEQAANNNSDSSNQVASLPEELFLREKPAEVSVSEARTAAVEGEQITLTGYIGGRIEPFVEGRAMFLVTDIEKAPQCTDGCPIPWDACCTPGDVIAANSATIQIVNDEGLTVPLSLKGENGLEAGKHITAIGQVHSVNDDVLIVDAENLFVHQ